MVQNGFESRVKVQQIIDNQLPEFILDESPKAVEFLRQYYISQEYQGGSSDLGENLDQYLKLDNLTPEVIVGSTTLSSNIDQSSSTIVVESTKGFPSSYGLLKIDDEIITYTGITTNSFTGCIRGFSGVTNYHQELNYEELVFSQSSADSHNSGSTVENLSSLFLKEFYKKLKYTLTPGLENSDFVPELNVGNFIKEAKTLYQSKGTEESFRILFNVLFGETPKVIDLEKFLIKPSSASFIRREIVVAEKISGDPLLLSGQTIKKSTDENTSASVSEVEIIRRKNKTYYKLLLFVGYNDSFPTITGTFNITGSTKALETVFEGSEVITVDSTIGFPESGILYSGNNIISYTSKSIDQFFGCSGITEQINTTDIIRSDETYYGYENGDVSKKVELRITGVLSDFKLISQSSSSDIGEEITIKNLGEVIKNPEINKTRKEIFANSWIYNTSSRYQIDYFDSGLISQVTLKTDIDKSSLKVGDIIEVLNRNSEIVIASNLVVTEINDKQISTNGTFTLNSSFNYDIRRKVNFASSSIVPLEFDNLKSDVQNVYNENDDYMYVASNSLPSYEIEKNIFTYLASGISGLDQDTGLYSIINFINKVSFFSGSEIYYSYSDQPISNLSEGIYYVEVINDKRQIRLYTSKSFIGTNNYIKFSSFPSGSHRFTLNNQKENLISAQKILRKFPLNTNIGDGESDPTPVGSVGMLINGVEISGYKTNDNIYYGPLESVNVLNGGNGYDVINPPLIVPSSGNALLQPIVRGSVDKIYVEPQEFDIDVLVSVDFNGGNGKGASFEPIIELRRREIEFDARQIQFGGGIDVTSETITFPTPHGLIDGQSIIYDPVNNNPIGIGTFGSLNGDTGLTLKNGATYYAKYISDTTIQLYQRLSDYRTGINTVGFTTTSTSGIHKFKTEPKKTLTEIKVINSGEGYENRKLIVKPTGISTISNTISFENHGFNDGELVTYSYETASISGLSTTNQYHVLKVDDNTFRLADAGIGGTYIDNYQRKKYVKFSTTGSGYQIFNYPEISLNVQYSAAGIGSTQAIGTINATPIVKGQIVGIYVYENGSDYGSTNINVHKKPQIIVKNGKNAQLKPIIINGQITDINIQYSGSEYYSTPEIKVIGSGIGALIKPIIVNNKLVDIAIINSGVGYDPSNTTILVEPAGKNSIFDPQVRKITINKNVFYGEEGDIRSTANELIISSLNNLQYTVSGYSQNIQEKFGDIAGIHSPIIGWSYDGNPIYGSYGYSNPQDNNSPIKRLVSGYTKNISNIENRPSEFSIGSFIEDYKFTNSGDLDEYNGRYCVTPEFPNGVYAYFATSVEDLFGNLVGEFPYFIGEKYRSKFILENVSLDQSFDFNNSNLVRNTLPYNVNEQFAGNDFIIESNEVIDQITVVESVSSGFVEDFDIIDSGDEYKIGDRLIFDEEGTDGSGLFAEVSSIIGKEIDSIETSILNYSDTVLTWENSNQIKVYTSEYHSLINGDYVNVSGVSTSLNDINGFSRIGVTTFNTSLINNVPSYAVSGIVTDIYVSTIPENISIGSSIRIENETLSVINIYGNENVLRVVRETTGTAHTATTSVNYLPNSFTIDKSSQYFESKVNDVVYFNPKQSIGVGVTAGIGIGTVYKIGTYNKNISIPTQSIYLPGHPFKTNQEVTLSKLSTSSAISVANTETSSAFNIPFTGNTQKVYVIKKSNDYIGIVTQVGLTTTTDGLFFRNNGSDDYFYSFETDYGQIKANIDSIITTVSISTSHGLTSGDSITLNVKPGLSVGVGTSSSVTVQYNSLTDKLVINPITFTSSEIDTTSNQITLTNHNLVTGDKIIYSSNGTVIGGLFNNNLYYVYKVDDNRIKLCETLIDSIRNSPLIINLTSSPVATHKIAAVNPPIKSIRNNSLVFDLTDSSLSGYNFKIFYDDKFSDEFISVGSTSQFTISTVGTVGISTNASLTINYNDEIPSTLFYALEKSGYISTADTEVQNYSQINFVDSVYNGSYNISGVGETVFNISLQRKPENTSYNSTNCDLIEYYTNSRTANGGIDRIRTISPGIGFKKIPTFRGIDSESGFGAYLIAKSNNIGKIQETRILNEGFEYSSDKTLRPTAEIPTTLTIKDSNTITNVNVIDGGKNYTSAPDLIIINSETRTIIESGQLTANISGTSINSVSIDTPPKGIPSSIVEIKAINNSNSVGIQSITSSQSGIVTCYLVTPLNGFDIEPFEVGDKIYVEGVQKYQESSDGFNSEDYGYIFFDVTNYENGGTLLQRKLEYNLSGITTNIGIAKTVQEYYGSITNYKNYPKFEVTQDYSQFINGEFLYIDNNVQDLKVVKNNESSIKVTGSYEPLIGQIIRGVQSGTLATINNVEKTTGQFNINYSSKKSLGWSDDIGKLDEDTQVIPDNDYYQNLSYSVRSNQEWENIVTPVNSILHPSGLKNFADTTITENVGVGTTSVEDYTSILYDIVDYNRVDTINNFDLVTDVDTINNTSKFLKLNSKKLTDYVEVRTNRVLEIDDISESFSSSDFGTGNIVNLLSISPSTKYNRYLLQITNNDFTQVQFTELVVINDDENVYTLEKGTVTNSENPIGEVVGYFSETGTLSLKMNPVEPLEVDYNIKILDNNFLSFSSGIGTVSIGFVDFTGSNTSINAGVTTSLILKDANSCKSLHSHIHIIDTVTNEMNYVEIYLNHDDVDTNIAEFYFDSNSELSSNFIGSFGASISNGILYLNYTNTSNNNVIVRSKNIGFNTTSLGNNVYRFKKPGQLDGFERTVNYVSDYSNVSSASTIVSLDISDFTSVKSVVKVSIGNTSALHQLMMISDNNNSYVIQYPFLSIGSTSGIGTFGSEISGSLASLKFYPDPEYSGTFEIISFSEKFFSDLDTVNTPPNLEYGNIIESVKTAKYYSANSRFRNIYSFDATYQGNPIFMKTFDPSDTDVLNLETGEFNIINHFFSTGEELIYRPASSFLGIGSLPLGIGQTLNHVGILTNLLPSTVYAYKINNDKFKLSTRKEYALAGICVTFTSIGEGNAHQLEMSDKNSKSIISIDNVVQYPISYSLLDYTVNNGSQIGMGMTIFALSGISSIIPGDILRIDEEYMKVVNVGLGTTNNGPITFNGILPLVEVERGVVGSKESAHNDSSSVKLYRGSFNIVGSQIHFTDPPNGSIEDQILEDLDNLPESRSYFNGRVFLRNDYSSNKVYDNISERFTGIDQEYTLSTLGINTVGLGTSGGNGIVFINGIFQTPTTENNSDNNYSIEVDTISGISSIVFSGITSSNGSIVISQSDVNMNQLPRGGLIVSLGSTPGLGYAPLVGASVTAIVSGGSITSIGIGTTGNYGSGYRSPVSVDVSESGHIGSAASITANVGAGGTLSFNIINGGSGYVNPTINISSPNYENLPVIGVSRLGVGATTDTGSGLLINVEVGASSTVGIGSTLFEVTNFSISRPGYGFKKGDVIKPVGLVTAYGLSSTVSDFELTVLDTFTDSFSAWEFGQIDYIDSIKNYQDGIRTRFPLYYNSQLLSFEKDSSNADSQLIDFDSLLLIFVNGILQQPKVSYQFNGGTSFTFTTPPKPEDQIAIFFYRGSSGDSSIVNVTESLKLGDQVQVYQNNNYLGITTTQNSRTIVNISASDRIQTDLYSLQGIDTVISKPMSWTKQKVDMIIDGNITSKSRDSLESQIYPTAKVIKNISTSDTEIYVDDAQFFNYENISPGNIEFDALIISGSPDPVSASVTSTVAPNGTIQSLTINNGGSGYIGTSINVSISAPPSIGVGIGTTATASISILNGSLSNVTITNPGFGYTTSNPPQIIVPLPNPIYENISNVKVVEGFSGNITGITTSSGIGTSLAIKFTLDPNLSPFTGLTVGQPIYIFNTSVGNGVISINNSNNNVVGVGTTFLDNIYIINSFNAGVGIITCNVHSSSSIVGIATTGLSVGKFSWGRLSGFTRASSPISIAVSSYMVNSGLSTFPTIQRRGYGLRDIGPIKKTL
jgi:hypothetical protein